MTPKKRAAIAVSIILVFVVMTISLVMTSLKKVDSSEVALRYNSFSKKIDDETYNEGLYLGTPGFQFIRFPSVFKTMNFESTKCLNKDGVTIEIRISFQYRVRSTELKYIAEQFKDEDGYDEVLQHTGASAIQDSCSRFNTSQFQAERGRFQEDLTARLVAKFERLECDVTDLQVNNINRPYQYDRAISAKESAREDIEVARNERPHGLTKSVTLKREASTEAEIILNDAKSEARIISTRAATDAQAVLNQYQKEAESYRALKDTNSLDNEGFLAYLGIRAIANSKNDVNVGMKAPAKSSYLT